MSVPRNFFHFMWKSNMITLSIMLSYWPKF